MYVSPASDFDAAQYIFIGEIVEVLDNVDYDSQGIKDKAVGFKVKVSENIYCPNTKVQSLAILLQEFIMISFLDLKRTIKRISFAF